MQEGTGPGAVAAERGPFVPAAVSREACAGGKPRRCTLGAAGRGPFLLDNGPNRHNHTPGLAVSWPIGKVAARRGRPRAQTRTRGPISGRAGRASAPHVVEPKAGPAGVASPDAGAAAGGLVCSVVDGTGNPRSAPSGRGSRRRGLAVKAGEPCAARAEHVSMPRAVKEQRAPADPPAVMLSVPGLPGRSRERAGRPTSEPRAPPLRLVCGACGTRRRSPPWKASQP